MLSYKDICNIDYLREEARLSLASSNSKPSSEKAAYLKNSEHLLKEIQENLINRSYKFSELRTKIIYEPKERKIDIPPFYPDRIYQHAMMDAVKDKFQEKFIDETYSSIKGRGLQSCKKKIESIISESDGWYYVNADVKKYFENIDHNILKAKIKELEIDDEIYKMHCDSIDVHEQGIAIGCYPSQYYANLYLADFDYMMLWVTNGKYVRYMDNCVFWVPTKQEAHNWLNYIKMYLSKFLGLTIKNNWQIAQVSKQPLRFCGYVFHQDHTLLRKNIKDSAKKKARKLDKAGVSDEEWKFQMAAYYGWFKSCSGAHLWKTLKKSRSIKMKQTVHKNVKSLKEIKAEGEFGLLKVDRISINDIVDTEILLLDAELSDHYRGGSKLIVKFQKVISKTPEGEITCGEDHYFITGSGVLKDKVLSMKSTFPFTCTVRKYKNDKGFATSYYTIE